MIRTPEELGAAVADDPRLRGWAVKTQGPGWIELEVAGLPRSRAPVIVVLCWPDLWRRRRRDLQHDRRCHQRRKLSHR